MTIAGGDSEASAQSLRKRAVPDFPILQEAELAVSGELAARRINNPAGTKAVGGIISATRS